MKILVIEDNQLLSENISRYLLINNIECIKAFSGNDGLLKFASMSFDAIILDLNLGDIDGIEVCQKIRGLGNPIPILILSSRALISNKIEGFEVGADDYLTKPFDYDELVARLHALVRRNQRIKGTLLIAGDIRVDDELKSVSKGDEKIELTSMEYNVLVYLLRNKGKVISKEELLEKVWGSLDSYMVSRTVDMYISYVRKKLGKELIKTIKSQGYIISD